jgi:hypothetical protein
VIELTILSQMHFSEFDLEAWLCLNLACKVVGRPRRWGPGAQIPQKSARNSAGNEPQIPRKIINKTNKSTTDPQTTTIKWNQLSLIFFLEAQGDRIDNSESNALLRI